MRGGAGPLLGDCMRRVVLPLLFGVRSALRLPWLRHMASFAHRGGHEDASSVLAARTALLEAMAASPRLEPVCDIDLDVGRFEAFKAFMSRYSLASLQRLGEISLIRRIVYLHLRETPAFSSRLSSLQSMSDPSAAAAPGGERPRFAVDLSKIYTSSEKKSHLAEAIKGLEAKRAALDNVRGSLKPLQDKVAAGGGAALADLAKREARAAELEEQVRLFERLVEALQAVEDLLASKVREVLARAAGPPELGGGRSASWGGRVGKQVEKEAAEVLQACLPEGTSLLTGVNVQSLQEEELLGIRRQVVRAKPHLEGVENPKGELDGLVVSPAPGDPSRLLVLLAVEVKRSLDEVAVDVGKFGLTLEICREASVRGRPDLIRFKVGKVKGPDVVSSDGHMLDFSQLPESLPEMCVYLTKRSGSALQAVNKVLFESIKLVEDNDRGTGRLLAYYGPELEAAAEGGATAQELEAAREGVVDELLEAFRARGRASCEARLRDICQLLANTRPALLGPEQGKGLLKNVFCIGSD